MENRYVVNIIYQEPFITQEGRLNVLVKGTTLGFKHKKEAEREYSKLRKGKVLEFPTEAGNISYSVISSEFVDRVLLNEYLERKAKEEQEKQEEELNEQNQASTEENGNIDNAANDESSSDNESQTEPQV